MRWVWAWLENSHCIWSNGGGGLQTGFGIRMQVPQSCGFLWYSSLQRDYCDPVTVNIACELSNSHSKPHWNVSSPFSHTLHIMASLLPSYGHFVVSKLTYLQTSYKPTLSLSNLEKMPFCLPKMEVFKCLKVIPPRGELRWILFAGTGCIQRRLFVVGKIKKGKLTYYRRSPASSSPCIVFICLCQRPLTGL